MSLEFAHDIQDAQSMYQHKLWNKNRFTDYFYNEIYDVLLEDFDIDLHDLEFNSP